MELLPTKNKGQSLNNFEQNNSHPYCNDNENNRHKICKNPTQQVNNYPKKKKKKLATQFPEFDTFLAFDTFKNKINTELNIPNTSQETI